MTRKSLLIVEFLGLFVAIPLYLFLHKPSVPPIPLLWIFALYCLIMLRSDPNFDRSQLWNPDPLRGQVRSILSLFVLGIVLISGAVYAFAPALLFSFLKTHPVIWALVMLLYPVLSVYPQGMVYRVFVMHRYRGIVKKQWALVLLSALAFSFMHIVFRNPVAVALTLAGGPIFAYRQLRTHSLFVSSAEHALYGCFVFTIGLGQFFFVRLI
jgi:uncharacterized protein